MVFFGKAEWKENRPAPVAADADVDDAATADADPALVSAAADAGDHGEAHAAHPHESPWMMTLPLVVLAILAAVAGFINLPFSFTTHWLEDWLSPVTGRYGTVLTYSNAQITGLLAISTVVALGGIGLAYLVFLRHKVPVEKVEPELFRKGWYYDLAISDFMGGPGRKLFEGLAWFDRTVVDGAVNGLGGLARGSGTMVRRVQNGYLRTYALVMTIGTLVVLVYVLLRINY